MPEIANSASINQPAGPTAAFKDPTSLTWTLKAMLYAGILLLVIGIWSGWLELQLLDDAINGYEISDEAAEINDLRQGLIGLLQIVLFIATAVVFSIWTYRANYNAHALGGRGMKYTPGWAVGWYFVPIANIIKPMYVMEEIYRVSENPSVNISEKKSVRFVQLWWALWLISGFVGQLAFRKSMRAEALEDLYESSAWIFAGDIIEIPAYIVALLLITKICEMQMSKVRPVTLSP
ncbi:MAG: DUF4328 domain-containing protein [Candidatus Zixiibacteriota bacterium]